MTKPGLTISRVLEILATGNASTIYEMADLIGCTAMSVGAAISAHRRAGRTPNLRIDGYAPNVRNQNSPIWKIGTLADAPVPAEPPSAGEVAHFCRMDSVESATMLAAERARAVERAAVSTQTDITANLARLRPLAGNVWGVAAIQIGGM